ncbi:GDSL esterase/lipase At5g45910-like isoform X1 [Triticum urartu]|uniref:GDSL esterase/lipase At5g45910-like isoform X1 n=1 Tax=Triticum urartu TaxID=4572 RepID=UPI0020446C32|nr:GDSL esterase/lipase At5g45910-like isoform X1 [Triticum urartu]
MKVPSFYLRSWVLVASLVIQLITAMASDDGSGTTSSTVGALKKYNAMFTFGDSMDETGNICAASSNKTELDVLTCTHPPYGETYFGRPSCRWCDGRVVVDFIAQALGLPFVPPSKAKGQDFRRGVSMAITGGTAMNFSFYKSLGIEDPVWNHGSLDTQIQWFKVLMPSICGTQQSCQVYLRKSLFMFGGYGGNDYNVQLLELGLTPEQAMNYTPKIVSAIANGIEKLIALGAVHVVVPGIFPTGCLPIFLSLFGDAASETDFDNTGCLKPYNRLTEYHNSLLRKQVDALQRKHHNSTRIMYADYYGLVYRMVQEPEKVYQAIRGVLRGGRGEVQLRRHREVRYGGGHHRVQRPVDADELGRHPPNGGGEQGDRRRIAQRTLLHPSDPRLKPPKLMRRRMETESDSENL